MPTPRTTAIVLTSGGLDSTTCLAIARAEGFKTLYSMTFDYGQRHRHELTAAARVAQVLGAAEHRVIHIDLRQFGHSALTSDIEVPKDRPESQMSTGVPITYVPARNTIFLSYALAWAEVLNCLDVYIGVNAIDYSGYPDCRPEFIEAFEHLANLATRLTTESRDDDKRMKDEKNGDAASSPSPSSSSFIHPRPEPVEGHPSSFRLHTPLLRLTKSQIIQRGVSLGVDYSLTHSCYDPTPTGLACGHCDSCLLRKKGFADALIPDPTRYA